MTDGDMSWIRVGKTKAWKQAKPEEIKAMVEKLNPESSRMSGGQIAGLVFGLIGMMALVVIVAVVLVKRRRRLGAVSNEEILKPYSPHEAKMPHIK
ncbi:Macrophage-expressed gene 1 protein [Liparis tanakae]|uniref:Macrophage-expressed gene 1 protein n=1 Tax=Liparis tanakae TaxID=230148 RepID=A0A4Z2E8A9_9TELE|nr:Macrophage-expressed gene 1 protein [Liparis tanakae]